MGPSDDSAHRLLPFVHRSVVYGKHALSACPYRIALRRSPICLDGVTLTTMTTFIRSKRFDEREGDKAAFMVIHRMHINRMSK